MSDGKNDDNGPFEDLDVDRLEVNVIESLCFQCGENVSSNCQVDVLLYCNNKCFIL